MVRAETKNKHSLWKTKHKSKDHDEIQVDMHEENATKLLNQPVDHDVTGSAQNYCLHCARYFINHRALTDHVKTKPHKRRMKALETDAYTLEEAERAGGMGSYVAPGKRKVETQPIVEKAEHPVLEPLTDEALAALAQEAEEEDSSLGKKRKADDTDTSPVKKQKTDEKE